MTYSFNVRLSRPYDEIKSWVESLAAPRVLAVQHDADDEVSRTHTHILIVASPVEALALKHKLERMCGKFTKGDWAFPKLKDDDFNHIAVYMSKGKHDYSMMKGFDFDWDNIKSQWIEPTKTQTQLDKNGSVIKIDKMKQSQMIDRVNLLLKEDNDYSIDNMLDKIRKVFIKENQCIVGRYKTRDIVDTLMAINEPSEWKTSLKRICEYRT